MPNAECDVCKMTLGPICKGPEEIQRFNDLVNERSSKLMGMITSISPGIRHNEIDITSDCNGVMWYKPLGSTPDNVSWGS